MARIFICSAHKSAFCDAPTSEIFLPHVYYNKLRNNYQYISIFINIITSYMTALQGPGGQQYHTPHPHLYIARPWLSSLI